MSLRVRSGAWLVGLMLVVGCSTASHQVRHERAMERRAEHWRRPPAERPDRAREAARIERSAYGGAPQEPNVPRVMCYDGTPAISCPFGGSYASCCGNQGGVYRDAWGNAVAQ